MTIQFALAGVDAGGRMGGVAIGIVAAGWHQGGEMGVVQHTEVNTTDPDEACELVSRLFCDHELAPTEGSAVAMTVRADELGPLSVVHLDYGATVRIRPDPLAGFYLVQVPRGGGAVVRQDGASVQSGPATASVLSPAGEVDMQWQGHTPQLCVYLRRDVVEREAELLLNDTLDEPLSFQLAMPLAEPGNASWLRSVHFLIDELRSGTSLVQRREVVDGFAATLAGQLLLSQPHNYSRRIVHEGSQVTSAVQQAVDHIEANIGDDQLSVPLIARAVGVSVRSLQESFRKELGVTPVAFIKNRRMLLAHRRLLAADPSVSTVTRIATSVGLSHLGRFSVDYRNRFGEPPSLTLARRASDTSGAH